jgi:hypothetical protein
MVAAAAGPAARAAAAVVVMVAEHQVRQAPGAVVAARSDLSRNRDRDFEAIWVSR